MTGKRDASKKAAIKGAAVSGKAVAKKGGTTEVARQAALKSKGEGGNSRDRKDAQAAAKASREAISKAAAVTK
jgi:hypothetical protein